jgi:RES domain
VDGFKSADAYLRFARKVKTSNRHVRDAEDLEFLSTLLAQGEIDRKRVLPKGNILWRAQLGFAWEPIWDGEKYIDDCAEGPFPPERMKPLRDQARAGRANPQGIPCLYVSNRKETALSEVRPWLRSLISIAQFKTMRKLTIVDFSSDERPRRRNYVIPPEEWNKAVWYAIDQAFRKPVTAEADFPSDYAPTQVIAEFFKAHGFDGIAYQSAFQDGSGQGHNVALFDPDAAELINCGLEEVREINFKFEQAANPYFVRPKEDASRNATPESNG